MAQVVNYETLYKAGYATRAKTATDYGKIYAGVNNYVQAKKKQALAYQEAYPDDIKLENVDAQIRPKLSRYLQQEREAYNEAAKTASRFPSWSKKHKQAVEEMNDIKQGYLNVSNGLNNWKKTVVDAGELIKKGDLAPSDNQEQSANTYIAAGGDYSELNFAFTRDGMLYKTAGEYGYSDISTFKIGTLDDKAGIKLRTTHENAVVSLVQNGKVLTENQAREYAEQLIDNLSDKQLKNYMFKSKDSYVNKLITDKGLTYTKIDENKDYAPGEKEKLEEQNRDYEAFVELLRYDTELAGEKFIEHYANGLMNIYNENKKASIEEEERKIDQKLDTEQQSLETREEFQIRSEQRSVQNQKELAVFNNSLPLKEDVEANRLVGKLNTEITGVQEQLQKDFETMPSLKLISNKLTTTGEKLKAAEIEILENRFLPKIKNMLHPAYNVKINDRGELVISIKDRVEQKDKEGNIIKMQAPQIVTIGKITEISASDFDNFINYKIKPSK